MKIALTVAALLIAACSEASTASPATNNTPPSSTSSTVPRGDLVPTSGSSVEMFAPPEIGAWPVVVTVHGGAWVSGDPAQMAPLAADLASRDMVVFNITYRAMDEGGRFPDIVEDVACGIVAAREAADQYSTTPDDLWVVAHSAGAQLAALVVLGHETFPCASVETPPVRGFVGLAGPYDVTRIAILSTLFGATLDEAPDLWAEGNPRTYVDTAPEDLRLLLVHGDADEVVPISFSTDLGSDLETAGRDVRLITLPGATHSDVRDPGVVGELIADFIEG